MTTLSIRKFNGELRPLKSMGAGLFVLDTPTENREVVYLLAGQLLGAFATAIAYWPGSSRGSAEKQRVLEAR